MDTLIHIWQILGALLGTLLILVALLWVGRQTVGQARGLWLVLRGQIPAVVSAVDEPSDPAIQQLALLTHLSPAMWSAFLTAFIQAARAAMDSAQNTPES